MVPLSWLFEGRDDWSLGDQSVDQSTMARRNPFSFTYWYQNKWLLMIICSAMFCITTTARKGCKTWWWACVKGNEEVSSRKKNAEINVLFSSTLIAVFQNPRGEIYDKITST